MATSHAEGTPRVAAGVVTRSTRPCDVSHSVTVQRGPRMRLVSGREPTRLQKREVEMSDDKRDVLEVLKFELQFLEQGGYGRCARRGNRPRSSRTRLPA